MPLASTTEDLSSTTSSDVVTPVLNNCNDDPRERGLTGPRRLAQSITGHLLPAETYNHASTRSEHTILADGEDPSGTPPPNPWPSDIAGRLPAFDERRAPVSLEAEPEKKQQVAWRDLPKKRQLVILTLARLSEPLTQSSLRAYMFYQIKSFDPSLPDSTISSQAGILEGSFAAAQCLTAILWGRAADSDWCGRKTVLLIGLSGTCLSCIGFGFSNSFWQAVCYRALGGVFNGNSGVMRTMVSEIVKEKKFQSRAFLLLPMCFNIGVIIGPILGGLLANPVESYPTVFGNDSVFGGKHGVQWMKRWPYVLPNLMSAVFLFAGVLGVLFGLEETLEALRDTPDFGLRIARSMRRIIKTRPGSHRYTALGHDDPNDSVLHGPRDRNYELEPRKHHPKPEPRQKLPFHRLWTRNVCLHLLTHFLVAFHLGTFNNLWFIFLSADRFNPVDPFPPSHKYQNLPFSFTGGLGMPPASVGFAMAFLGVVGITLQLAVYPSVTARVGTLRSFRYALLLFPIVYNLVPYLSVIPSSTLPPEQASGVVVWAALCAVLFIQVLARTFAIPALTILINNCSPHPSVLGTIHGIGQSMSSAGRTIGPVLGGWGFGIGLKRGVVGGVWWALAGMAGICWVVSGFLWEGDGHEIVLEGEEGDGEGGEAKQVVECRR